MMVHEPGERLIEEADLPDDVQPAHGVQLNGRVLVVAEPDSRGRAVLLQVLHR